MIARLFFKVGLGVLVPYLFQIGIGALIAGGGVSTWLLDWTDWQTSALLVVAIVLVGLLYSTEKPWARTAIALVIGATLYIKGRIDENVGHAAEIAEVEVKSERRLTELRTGYARAVQEERDRQSAINAETMKKADDAKAVYDKAKDELRSELARIRQEATHASDAGDIVFDADDIESLNRLRYDPRKRAKPARGRGGKTKDRKNPKLAPAAVSAPARPAKKSNGQGNGEGIMGYGLKVIRGLSPSSGDNGQAGKGAGRSPGWKGF